MLPAWEVDMLLDTLKTTTSTTDTSAAAGPSTDPFARVPDSLKLL